jgi:hypothetical protein
MEANVDRLKIASKNFNLKSTNIQINDDKLKKVINQINLLQQTCFGKKNKLILQGSTALFIYKYLLRIAADMQFNDVNFLVVGNNFNFTSKQLQEYPKIKFTNSKGIKLFPEKENTLQYQIVKNNGNLIPKKFKVSFRIFQKTNPVFKDLSNIVSIKINGVSILLVPLETLIKQYELYSKFNNNSYIFSKYKSKLAKLKKTPKGFLKKNTVNKTKKLLLEYKKQRYTNKNTSNIRRNISTQLGMNTGFLNSFFHELNVRKGLINSLHEKKEESKNKFKYIKL